MTKPLDTRSIEKATGITWPEWLKFLDGINAKELSHPEIAHKVYEHIVDLGIFDNEPADALGRQNPSGWWSQNVTVAYEQHIGRRQPGQRADGTFEVAVAKTYPGSMDDVFVWWLDKVAGLNKFNGITFKTDPTTSQTDKRRHWAVNLADGTRITADASPKDATKCLFAVTVMKLPTPESLESWRAYWKEFLSQR